MSGSPKWFGHVNLNVRDLSRAEGFYRDMLGLSQVWRTAPSFDQSGAVFEIDEQVRWDGVLMGDDRGQRGPVLDVLQWQPAVPQDAITEPRYGHRWGLDRLLFEHPDLEEIEQRLRLHEFDVRRVDVVRDEQTTYVLHGRDPDGAHYEIRQADVPGIRFRGVRLNCSSIERSRSFYRRALKMTATDVSVAQIGETTGQTCIMRFGGARDTFGVELWEPSPDVLLPRALSPGNHPGLYRMALVTEDFQASLALLADLLPEPARVARVDIGAGAGFLDAVFFEDPDGAVVEFVEHGVVVASQRATESAEV